MYFFVVLCRLMIQDKPVTLKVALLLLASKRVFGAYSKSIYSHLFEACLNK